LREVQFQEVAIKRLTFKSSASVLVVAISAASLACVASGCWMAAVQLAPVAIQVAKGAGQAAVNVTQNAAKLARGNSGPSEAEQHAAEESLSGGDSCYRLQLESPGVIELRRNHENAPEYRELVLTAELEQPQWTPIIDHDTGAGGWRPAMNFTQMNFVPPLEDAFPEDGSDYLAFTPVDAKTEIEKGRVAALTENFAQIAGTFNWRGQPYQYTVTRTLPCFPAPTLAGSW
jgi:hypothetical protein